MRFLIIFFTPLILARDTETKGRSGEVDGGGGQAEVERGKLMAAEVERVKFMVAEVERCNLLVGGDGG